MLEEKVLNTINRYNMIQEKDKIVVGVSGGPDSISLLNILNILRKLMKKLQILILRQKQKVNVLLLQLQAVLVVIFFF